MMHSSFSLAATATVIAIGVLAGCASTPPAPSASPTVAGPTPTPTPTQAAETGLVPPAQIFGGECDELLTDAEAGDILGVTIPAPEPFTADPSQWGWFDGTARLPVVGGLTCGWNDGTFESRAFFDAVPAAAAPTVTGANDCATGRDEGGAYLCEFDFVAGDIRFAGLIQARSAKSTNAARDALIAQLTERAENADPVPLPIPAVDAWSNPVLCPALDAALADDFLSPGTTAQLGSTRGSAYETPVYRDLVGIERGDALCQFSATGPESRGVDVIPIGGAAWVQDEVSPANGFEPIEIGGADSAFVHLPGQNERGVVIVVIDGPNAVWIRGDVDQPVAEGATLIAEQVLAAVNSIN